MALTYTPVGELGSKCPTFNLPGVDGKTYSQADLKTGMPFLVMFICNHCPYVKAIEDRLITLGQDLKKMGVGVFAICSNDGESYPDDSFENLQKRWQEKSYPFPYLHDATQEVAKKFGAVCTPDFFVYDSQGELAYRGRLDNAWKDPNMVTKRELFEAVQVLVQHKKIETEQIPSMGCNIKWLK